MSALLQTSGLRPDEIGPLAARAGVTPAEAAAVKRHAARLESSGDLGGALDAWRVALKLTPGDARTWDGVARCLAARGELHLSEAVSRAAAVIGRRS